MAEDSSSVALEQIIDKKIKLQFSYNTNAQINPNRATETFIPPTEILLALMAKKYILLSANNDTLRTLNEQK